MTFTTQLFQSNNLILQAYDPEKDAAAEAAFSYDPNYSRVISWSIPHPLTVIEVKKKREEELKKNSEKDNFFLFSIHRKSDDAFMGTLNFPEVFWINRYAFFMLAIGDPELQPSVYPEALQLALQYGLEELSLHSMYTSSGDYDLVAYQALEAAGFTPAVRHRESVFRNGRLWDAVFMELLQDEWLKTRREVQL